MANDNTHKKFSIILFPGLMSFLVFLALLCAKLFTERGATLSWIWVVSPFWIPWAFAIFLFLSWYALAGVVFIVCYAIMGITMFFEWIREKIFKRKHEN